ncbi:unnamed protein product [Somion occarium]|uniref:Uncharacterized protein n=1 Tax=Somion occarium TaxID=3059160 RepID=A0ABP1CRU9_9APHY
MLDDADFNKAYAGLHCQASCLLDKHRNVIPLTRSFVYVTRQRSVSDPFFSFSAKVDNFSMANMSLHMLQRWIGGQLIDFFLPIGGFQLVNSYVLAHLESICQNCPRIK